MRSRAVVVDDDVASAVVIAKLLGRLDCDAAVCTDPQEAVALCLDGNVDMVSLDLTMPRLDGYQVLSLIRSHEHTRRSACVPVVTVTGRVTAADKADALASGFAGHLGKPLLMDDLREALARALILRGDLHRTRYSMDREAIEACVHELCSRSGADRFESVAGLALAVEQQGRDLLRRALMLAFGGNALLAGEPIRSLGELAGAVGARQLQSCCDAIQPHLASGGPDLGTAAVLARAELDRVIYTLREQVLA